MSEQIKTIEGLKKTLARLAFAKSCIDFGWNFEVEELLDIKVERAFFGGPDEDDNSYTPKGIKGWFVNTTFKRPDTHTGEIGIGRGRKEFIPFGSYEDSVIKTAWVLCEMIVRHELMEAFLVDGKRIFDPHSSIEVLQYGKELCTQARPINNL